MATPSFSPHSEDSLSTWNSFCFLVESKCGTVFGSFLVGSMRTNPCSYLTKSKYRIYPVFWAIYP